MPARPFRTADRDPARGTRPRGCRAPARRVLGRRVRYHIGCEPGQVNGRRWPVAAGSPAASGAATPAPARAV
ncbi:tryptophan biosynthesis modulator TrpM [Streptomyces marincola]|uniref:tryptophan biosynthesis modulator TrpM n=1 Tax=Streptomyces marincola TaxID=2878388 RepID=UPI000D1B7467